MKGGLIMSQSSDVEVIKRMNDRIISTPDDKILAILDKLLPGLLPLTNQTHLRDECLKLIAQVIKRVKQLQLPLQCDVLIGKLISPEYLPFCSNITLSLVDVAIKYQHPDALVNCLSSSLQAIEKFGIVINFQTNSLCYYILEYIEYLPVALPLSNVSETTKRFVYSLLFDIFLLNRSIQKEGIGSLQPGLKQARINRLCAKKAEWSLEQINSMKAKIMKLINQNWVHPTYVLLYSLASLHIDNQELNIIALSKLNESKTYLRSLAHDVIISVVCPLLQFCVWESSGNFMMSDCSSVSSIFHNGFGTIDFFDRSNLSSEIVGVILHWFLKEFLDYFKPQVDVMYGVIIMVIYGIICWEMQSPSVLKNSTSVKLIPSTSLILTSAQLLQKLSILDSDSFILRLEDSNYNCRVERSVCLVQTCISAIFRQFEAVSTTADSTAVKIRTIAYNVLYEITKLDNLQFNSWSFSVTSNLFQLLEKEEDSNLSYLLNSLSNLRIQYERDQFLLKSEFDALVEVVKRSLVSKQYRRRLISVKWMHALLGWSKSTIDYLLLMADDENELVGEEVLGLFKGLSKYISSATPAGIAEVASAIYGSTFINLRVSGTNHLKFLIRIELFDVLFGCLKMNVPDQYKLNEPSGDLLNTRSYLPFKIDIEEYSCDSLSVLLPSSVMQVVDISYITLLHETEDSSQYTTDQTLTDVVTSILHFCLKYQLIGFDYFVDKIAGFMSSQSKLSLQSLVTVGSIVGYVSFNHHVRGDVGIDGLYNFWRILHHKLNSLSSETNQSKDQLRDGYGGMIIATSLVTCIHRYQGRYPAFCKQFYEFQSHVIPSIVDITLKICLHQTLVKDCTTDEFVVSFHVCMVEIVRIFSSDLDLWDSSLVKLINWYADFSRIVFTSAAPLSYRKFSQSVYALSSIYEIFPSTEKVEISSLFKKFFLKGETLEIEKKFVVAECLERITMKKNPLDYPTRVNEISCEILNVKDLTPPHLTNAAILLLVNAFQFEQGSSNPYSRDVLLQIAINFIAIIRGIISKEKLVSCEASAQDICSMGLCHLYNISRESNDLANQLSELVLLTLKKDRKKIQPVGVSVAGETTDDVQRAADGENAASNQPEEINTQSLDSLLTALSSANQMNTLYELQTGGNTLGQRQQSEYNQGNYGIISKVCHIAYKTKSNDVLFGLLYVLRRDPLFGLAGSPTEVIYKTFKPTEITVSPDTYPAIIPILFMSKFDSSKEVSEILSSLWDKLIMSKLTFDVIVNKYGQFMYEYAVDNLNCPNWRDRFCACRGLEKLFQHLSWKIIEVHVEKLWQCGMKCLDDIRDNVRLAAFDTMKLFSNILITSLERGEVSRSIESFIVTRIIKVDILSPAMECRGFVLGLLLKIIGVLQDRIKPYLASIISILIEAMSALEPQILQYMQLHSARLQVAESDLETNRLRLSQQSVLQEALTKCVNYMFDSESGEERTIICNVLEHSRDGVGLLTRVTALRTLVEISKLCPRSVKQLSDRIVTFLLALLFPNPPSSSSLLRESIQTICELAKVIDADPFLVNIFNNLHYHDFRKVESTNLVLAELIRELLTRMTEKGIEEDLVNIMIPLCYIETFHSHAQNKAVWKESFNEVLNISKYASKTNVVVTFVKSILSDANEMIQSLSWDSRVQGIYLLQDVLETSSATFDSSLLAMSMVHLFKLIPGKYWKGKELVFDFISQICVKFPQNYSPTLPVEYENNENVLSLTKVDSKQHAFSLSMADLASFSHTGDLVNEFIEQSLSTKSSQLASFEWRINFCQYIQVLFYFSEFGQLDNRVATYNSLLKLPLNSLAEEAKLQLLLNYGKWHRIFDRQEKKVEDVEVNGSGNGNERVKRANVFGERYGRVYEYQAKQSRIVIDDVLETEDAMEIASTSAVDRVDVPAVLTDYVEPPAIRVKMIEVLVKLLPGYVDNDVGSNVQLRELLLYLLKEMITSYSQDVWSIKRAYLIFIGALVNKQWFIFDMNAIMNMIIICGCESKYNQVTQEALSVLDKILSSSLKVTVVEQYKAIILQTISNIVESAENPNIQKYKSLILHKLD